MTKYLVQFILFFVVAISAIAQPTSREELEKQRAALKNEIEQTEKLLNSNKLKTKEN